MRKSLSQHSLSERPPRRNSRKRVFLSLRDFHHTTLPSLSPTHSLPSHSPPHQQPILFFCEDRLFFTSLLRNDPPFSRSIEARPKFSARGNLTRRRAVKLSSPAASSPIDSFETDRQRPRRCRWTSFLFCPSTAEDFVLSEHHFIPRHHRQQSRLPGRRAGTFSRCARSQRHRVAITNSGRTSFLTELVFSRSLSLQQQENCRNNSCRRCISKVPTLESTVVSRTRSGSRVP